MAQRIVVTVEGGIANVAAKPAGIEVVIVDVDGGAADPVRISTEAEWVDIPLDDVMAAVLEVGGLPEPGTEAARRLLGLKPDGTELTELVLGAIEPEEV
jgi:hypothetical protein